MRTAKNQASLRIHSFVKTYAFRSRKRSVKELGLWPCLETRLIYSTRRFVVCLSMCHFVLVFFSPFSIAITSLGEERAFLSIFRSFVWFVLVWICRFPPTLGVWEGLRFVIMAFPGLFSYLFFYSVKIQRAFVFAMRPIHYEVTPFQMYRRFHPQKTENFQIKNSRYVSYFCSKHRLWVLFRTASARRF